MNLNLGTSVSKSNLGFLLLLAFACIYLVYIPDQGDFTHIILPYGLAFISYYFLVKRGVEKSSFTLFIVVGLLIRVCLLFALPNLSDDLYRFIWDGRLLHQGISPFMATPTELVSNPSVNVDPMLYESLNSKDYYSVYPPLAQVIYLIGSFYGLSIWGSSLVMKLILLSIECLGCFYLIKLLKLVFKVENQAYYLGVLYFLNPLLIVEGVGNIHFETIMLSLLAISFYYLYEKKWVLASLFLALSISTKLIPIILLPFLMVKIRGKAKWIFIASTSLFLLICFIPLLWSIDIQHFMQSLDLYFRKFEFNASIYYLLRAIGYEWYGYNKIAVLGPYLALLVVSLSFYYIFWKARKEVFSLEGLSLYGLFALTSYYVCSTTVHPWYICNLIFLSLFTRFRYPMFWASLVPLTYINYSYDPYFENLWIVFFEYVLLFIFILNEWKYKKHVPLTKSI